MKITVTTLHFSMNCKKHSNINAYLSNKCSKSYVTLTLHNVTIPNLENFFYIILYSIKSILSIKEDEKKKIKI